MSSSDVYPYCDNIILFMELLIEGVCLDDPVGVVGEAESPALLTQAVVLMTLSTWATRLELNQWFGSIHITNLGWWSVSFSVFSAFPI